MIDQHVILSDFLDVFFSYLLCSSFNCCYYAFLVFELMWTKISLGELTGARLQVEKRIKTKNNNNSTFNKHRSLKVCFHSSMFCMKINSDIEIVKGVCMHVIDHKYSLKCQSFNAAVSTKILFSYSLRKRSKTSWFSTTNQNYQTPCLKAQTHRQTHKSIINSLMSNK